MIVADLEFTVAQSPHRRTVGITVDRDGSLLLHAPDGCSESTLAEWAHSKRMWVYRKLAEKDLLLAPPARKQFLSGEGFDALPAFSPDGRYLMWTSTRGPEHTSQIFVAKFKMPEGS